MRKSDWAAIRWIFKIGKSQIPKVIVLLFTNALGAALSIYYANFSKHIINGATEYKDMHYVIRYAVYLLILIMVQLLLNLVGNSFSERCKGRLDMIFKKHMLQTVMKKDYSSVAAYHTGDLNNLLFNDVLVITENFTTLLPNVVFFVVKLLSAFIYLVVIDRVFALVFLIGGIFVFLFTRMFRKTLKRLHKQVQATEGKTRSFIQEAISNLLVVKTFVVEDKISDATDVLQAENYAARMKRRFFGIAANAGLSTTFNVGYVFALAFGAYRLLNGLDYGTVTAMLQLVNQIQGPFASLSGIMPKYYAMLASAERLMEIEALPDEDEDNQVDIDVQQTYKALEAIHFDHIDFKYDRDVILSDTSLDVRKGDFVAIMGISGIGKSTLLKLLLGVFKVQGGAISLQLQDGSFLPVDKHTRRLFAYVPQGNMLLSGTILDNLKFINADATQSEVDEAVRIACAKSFIDELPDGLMTVIGEHGLGLSEGQVQRLAIARSLLSKSPVLLLDEATSALDEETEKQFLTNLKALNNVTCIIVSHKKAALEICNKHVQIIDSKIVSEDNGYADD